MADTQGGGANSEGGCKKLLFGHFFPKNCMKLKEFGPRGVRPCRPLHLRSANGSHDQSVPTGVKRETFYLS